MTYSKIAAFVIAASVLPLASISFAQSNGPAKARTEVKMETAEFLRTHSWDPAEDAWVMNKDVMPPQGVKSRAEVIAARDKFLAENRWDKGLGWVPVKADKGSTSPRTSEQLKMEAKQFAITHMYNEGDNNWVERNALTK